MPEVKLRASNGVWRGSSRSPVVGVVMIPDVFHAVSIISERIDVSLDSSVLE